MSKGERDRQEWTIKEAALTDSWKGKREPQWDTRDMELILPIENVKVMISLS